MSKDGIGTSVSLLGDKEYKASLGDIGRQLRVLQSDMKASQSAFGTQDATVDGLRDKQEKLSAVYKAQADKVKLVAEQLEKAKQDYGDNSKQADGLRIALNNATIAMNNTKEEVTKTDTSLTKLEKAVGDTKDESAAYTLTLTDVEKAEKKAAEGAVDASEGSDKYKNSAASLGDALKTGLVTTLKAAAVAFAAVGAAALAGTKAAFDMAKGAGTYADDLLTLSSQTSISAKTLQEWGYAANFIDTDVSTMTGSMAKMIKQMGEAGKGSETASDKFKVLGVSITDSVTGELRSSEDVFWDSIDALGKISNETQRDAMAMDLFGKSAQELNPLIKAGSAGMRELSKEAQSMGVVMSDEALAAMGSFDDSMQRVNATGAVLKNSIGLMLIPAFQPLVDVASVTMAKVATAIQDGLKPEEMVGLVGELVDTFAGTMTNIAKGVKAAMPIVIAALNGVVGAMVGVLPSLLSSLLPAVTGIFQSVLDALVSNTEPLSELATELATSLASFVIENAGKLVNAATSLLMGLVNGLSAALPVLLPAAAGMIAEIALGLAQSLPAILQMGMGVLTNLVSGMLGALPVLIEALPQVLNALVEGLATALPLLLEQGGSLLTSVIDDIVAAIPLLAQMLPQVIATLLSAISGALPLLLEQGTGVINSVVGGIVAAIPVLVEALPQVITAIIGALTTALPTILAQGTSILTSILDGIIAAIPTLVAALPALITAVITALVDALPLILEQGTAIITSLISGFVTAIPALIEALPLICNAIWTALTSIDWATLGLSLIQGLVDGLGSALLSLGQSILDVFASIWTAIKGVFGINSPSTVATEAGGFILDGFLKGFSDAISAVCDTVKVIFGKIWDAIKSIFGFGGQSDESKAAKTAGKDIMSGMKDGIIGSQTEVETAVKNASKTVLDALRTAFGITDGTNSSVTKGYGEKVAKGIADGLSALDENAFSAGAATVFAAISTAINSAFGVEGTGLLGLGGNSATKFVELGKAVCKAIADGIAANNGNTEAVKQAITTVANAAYQAAVEEMATGITGGTETINAAVLLVCGDALTAASTLITPKEGTTLGADWMEGVGKGIQSKRPSLLSTLLQVLSIALDTAKRVMSGSVGEDIGRGFAQGVSRGISSKAYSVRNEASTLASSALAALWNAVGKNGSRFDVIGDAIAEGVARGIRNGSVKINKAARAAALGAYNASKSALEINSPSKLMERMGDEGYDGGFAGGIERGMGRVLASARALANRASSETQRSFEGLQTGTFEPPFEIDYIALGEAVAAANVRSGLGTAVIDVDGRELGRSIEPEVSRASYRRGNTTAAGRGARMVFA